MDGMDKQSANLKIIAFEADFNSFSQSCWAAVVAGCAVQFALSDLNA
jgi:hypothetical protein